ncbi:TIGR03364 family FAD-dependent oxidoreductase [Marinactinospora thermotolerans]|uniref:TIGR03364 family FAD-dependent oxidoreductase n=1 Tax=Marinactinospora thermotolerans TaxID=531310 RepID=UPI00190EA918|nr:TIGR03364 family FAD-dependent oxidoreductase [Marinactinospora thermotolerans]
MVVIGGGVLGTMHAWHAVERGHEVVQIEREADSRGASLRNFGLVWVSGRPAGRGLQIALRARTLWERIGGRVPGLGFRANGSLTVLRTPGELAVAQEFAQGGSLDSRGTRLVDPEEARTVNPALRGPMLGALWCERDAAVEPRVAQRELRAHLLAGGRYTWLPGREVRHVDTGVAVDDHGDRHHGDVIIVCPGAALSGLVRELAGPIPVRRVRLQMMQTAPLGERLTTSVADGDSLRYYPAYAGPALERLVETEPQPEVAAHHRMQLLMVQRADGGLTIGDTHAYAEPFDFDVATEPYDHLETRVAELLGRPLPSVRRRWAGVYAQADDGDVVYRRRVSDGVWLLTGTGGGGMTCSPAIAEETVEELGL